MIEKSHDKQIRREDAKVKQVFFFPGGGEFIPQNVEATDPEEALKEYEKTRTKYNK